MCGNVIGLILVGGGVKGFVYIGVYWAFLEKDVLVDIVGGMSVGVMLVVVIFFDIIYE